MTKGRVRGSEADACRRIDPADRRRWHSGVPADRYSGQEKVSDG